MGASIGCQPSWDASDSPGCLTFLLAYQKNIYKVRFFMPRVTSTFILNIFISFSIFKTNILFGINISTNF